MISVALGLRISSDSGKFSTGNQIVRGTRRFGSISGQRWGDFDGFDCKVLGPVATLSHLGDHSYGPPPDMDSEQKREFKMNVGKAIDVLGKQLPMIFMCSDLDFSIFAPQITVTDTRQNKFVMQKSLYTAAVKSLRMASSFSSMYPSLGVRKIEYIEECSAIHALVSVKLPDSIRIDGSGVWEGSFFFGVDKSGFINAHTFDRKITNLHSNPLLTSSYPWVKAGASPFVEDLFSAPVPKRGLVTSYGTNSNHQDEV